MIKYVDSYGALGIGTSYYHKTQKYIQLSESDTVQLMNGTFSLIVEARRLEIRVKINVNASTHVGVLSDSGGAFFIEYVQIVQSGLSRRSDILNDFLFTFTTFSFSSITSDR